MKRSLALFLAASLACAQSPLAVLPPAGDSPLRTYRAPSLPPPRLENTNALYERIRAGKLHLTADDAIRLAIENNLGLEISRYGPLNAEWQLLRAEAGGPLRGVTSGNSQIGQVAAGQGVAGSQASAGIGGGGGGGGSSSAGGAAVSQIGPVTANLDPVIQNTTLFSHATHPQVNTRQSQTTALTNDSRLYNTTVQQGLLSGGFATVNFRQSYLLENAPTNILNPSVAPRAQLYVQHNLLQGFGEAVNKRFIHVAANNIKGSGESFRSELIDLVTNVLNLYWGLVVDIESLRSRQRALDIASRFYGDTQKRIAAGVVSRVDIFRAEREMSARRRDLAEAQNAVRQRETALKNALSKRGLEDPLIEAVEIVPIDAIRVPSEEVLPALRELVDTALRKRPDVAAARIRLENARTSALGTQSGILPQLVGVAQGSSNGLAGTGQAFRGATPNPDLIGSLATALSQVVRGQYLNHRAIVFAQGNLRNRIDQGDYGIDQLQLRQSELQNLRYLNQIVVDLSNQIVALRQSRARFAAAEATRQLQLELLEKQQRMFNLGVSTVNELISAQRSLVAAETSEIASLGAYIRARIGLDQVLGETLEKNRVSLENALQGSSAYP